jgi:hypothetical protein
LNQKEGSEPVQQPTVDGQNPNTNMKEEIQNGETA